MTLSKNIKISTIAIIILSILLIGTIFFLYYDLSQTKRLLNGYQSLAENNLKYISLKYKKFHEINLYQTREIETQQIEIKRLARENTSRKFAYSALQQLNTDKKGAFQSAISACEHYSQTFEAQDILLSMLVEPFTQIISPLKHNHKEAVLSIAVSDTKEYFATGSSDGKIHIWKMTDHQPVFVLPSINNQYPVSSLIFCRQLNDRIIVGDSYGRLRLIVIDYEKGLYFPPKEINVSHENNSELFFLSMHPSTGRLIAGYRNKIEIYIPKDEDFILQKKLSEKFQYKTMAVKYQSGMSGNINDDILMAGLSNHTIKMYDLNDFCEKYVGEHKGVNNIVFYPKKNKIISSGFNRQLCQWDLDVQLPLSSQKVCKYIQQDILSLGLSSDGRRLISGNCDHTTSIWMPDDLQLLMNPGTQHNNSVSVITSLGDYNITGDYDGKLEIWNSMPRPPILMNSIFLESILTCLTFHPIKPIIAAGDELGHIFLITVLPDTLEVHPIKEISLCGPINEIHFSPDGTKLLFCSDNEIGIFDTIHQKTTNIPVKSNVRSVCFYPVFNSTTFVSHHKNTLIKHEINENSTVSQNKLHLSVDHKTPIQCITFSPDGSKIASAASDCHLIVQSTEPDFKPWEPFIHIFDSDISCLTFSTDNTLLAIGDAYGTIHLLNMVSRELSVLGTHDLSLSGLAFNPIDSNILISASFDKTIRIWDITHKKNIGNPITAHISHIESIAFHSTAQMFVSCGGDKYLYLWEFDLNKWLERAKKIILQN